MTAVGTAQVYREGETMLSYGLAHDSRSKDQVEDALRNGECSMRTFMPVVEHHHLADHSRTYAADGQSQGLSSGRRA